MFVHRNKLDYTANYIFYDFLFILQTNTVYIQISSYAYVLILLISLCDLPCGSATRKQHFIILRNPDKICINYTKVMQSKSNFHTLI